MEDKAPRVCQGILVDFEGLRNQLIVDEGLKLKAYKDTVGKLTIGIGRNLTDKGISREESFYLCNNDIYAALRDLSVYEWFKKETDLQRKNAFLNMMFNLGASRFAGFKNMIAAAARGDFASAASAALDSKWAEQVGHRAMRIAHDMQYGQFIKA